MATNLAGHKWHSLQPEDFLGGVPQCTECHQLLRLGDQSLRRVKKELVEQVCERCADRLLGFVTEEEEEVAC